MPAIDATTRRRFAIKMLARTYFGQPLHPHVIRERLVGRVSQVPTEATIKRDIRAIIDANPMRYALHRGALMMV